jgi:hypothetical protein
MNIDKSIGQIRTIGLSEFKLYGGLSRAFLIVCVLVSFALLMSHGVIHGVKMDIFTIEQLETLFFPGVYWTFAASCVTLLALSALLIGLTIALAVVRACLHTAPCKFYWFVLSFQFIPWLFFFATTSFTM